ncbi:MAG TPA: hypothetical protein PLA96_06215 [Candidatus Brocadia sapporoensis]|nr:hypothetical protein [Candidatus Brocadia sapporoensis]HQU31079.1 hypothetical protein [Candidatus Brocadia sapporoensis]
MEGKTMYLINPFLVGNPDLIRRFKWGIPADFWLKNIDYTGKFITENQIRPVPIEALATENPQGIFAAREQEKALLPHSEWFGGIKIPHLHFKRDIYLLNEIQWRRFSENIINDFRKKLDNVKTVGFEQVMEMSNAIDSIVV